MRRVMLFSVAVALGTAIPACASKTEPAPLLGDTDAGGISVRGGASAGAGAIVDASVVDATVDAAETMDASQDASDGGDLGACFALAECCSSPSFPAIELTGCEFTASGGTLQECATALASYRSHLSCP